MVAEIVSPPLFPTLVKPSSRAIDLSVRCQVFHRFSLGGFHLVVIAQTTTKCRKDPGDLLNRMLLFYLWMECKTDVESYSWIVFTVPDFIRTSIDLLKLLFLLFFSYSTFLFFFILLYILFFFFFLFIVILYQFMYCLNLFVKIYINQLGSIESEKHDFFCFLKLLQIIFLLFEMLLQYKYDVSRIYLHYSL